MVNCYCTDISFSRYELSPRLVRQHRLRRSRQLPSRHTSRGHLPVLSIVRSVVDGHFVHIRSSSLREARVSFQSHAFASTSADASIQEISIFQLGHCRVFHRHYRPPDRCWICHVRMFCMVVQRCTLVGAHSIVFPIAISAINYFFGLP